MPPLEIVDPGPLYEARTTHQPAGRHRPPSNPPEYCNYCTPPVTWLHTTSAIFAAFYPFLNLYPYTAIFAVPRPIIGHFALGPNGTPGRLSWSISGYGRTSSAAAGRSGSSGKYLADRQIAIYYQDRI